MSRSTDPGRFFQTDASESTRARRAAKSGNKNGNPIVLQSKILSVIPDPFSTACVYIAESAGCVRKVNIEVSERVSRVTIVVLIFVRLEIRRPSIEGRLHLLPLLLLVVKEGLQYSQDAGTRISGAGIEKAKPLDGH